MKKKLKKTQILQLRKNEFRLQYGLYDHEDISKITCLIFKMQIRDQKIDFIFLVTYKREGNEIIDDIDKLFPEEIQIAMFKKFLETYPEIIDKINTARKINCYRSNISNQTTLSNIYRYLQNNIADEASAVDSKDAKKLLESTPNQSNSYNFINQLNQLLETNIKPSTAPKITYTECTGGINIKQSFAHSH